LTQLERDWLTYARCVIVDKTASERRCCLKSRAAIEQTLWPGYLGFGYETSAKRVLLVAAVHNESKLYIGALNRMKCLESKARAWATRAPGAPDDEQYLDLVRCAYQQSARYWAPDFFRGPPDPEPGTPWGALFRIMKALGVGISDIAFTNLAKCKLLKPRRDDKARFAQYTRDYNECICACMGDAIKAIRTDILKPSAIFIACGTRSLVKKARQELANDDAHLRIFDQGGNKIGRSRYPDDEQPFAEWLAADAAALDLAAARRESQ
jgi:hypothetical protein